jgi:hypothetical protein
VTPDPNSDLHRKIYQLRAMPAATAPYGSSSEVLPTPTPVQHWTPAHDLSAFSQNPWPYPGESPTAFNASRPIRPRSHYCWLHGRNTSHNSPQCKKMMASAEVIDYCQLISLTVNKIVKRRVVENVSKYWYL